MLYALDESTVTATSTQIAEQSQYEMIRDYLEQLELPASVQLMSHAASTTHEDLPHDHECGISCMAESRGTATPTCSVLSGASCLVSSAPPSNFAAVLPGMIYRSSFPQEKNYEYLKGLKIKSILTLVPEPITPEYQAFMKEAGIQHFQVHIRANKGGVKVESCEMSRALRLIMDRTNHPILIHCNKGKHRTGCTVACFRRIIGYEMDAIVEDYHTYAGVKARFMDEVFFESFDLNNVMWMARKEGWVAPEMDITLPSPPASPVTSVVPTKLRASAKALA